MANWYTSTRNGNDTTGDGSIGSPFATIYKAATLATTGDTINTEGDELINSGATVTSTSGTSTTFTTSTSLTGVLAAGSIFTIDDPVWGLGKIWFKVRSITSTSITLMQASGVLGTFDLHYIATPSYSTTSTSVQLEDLSSLTLDGINFEGGWDPTFTTQDRITWATYITTGTGNSSAYFLRLGTSGYSCAQSNLSFNRFGATGIGLFNAGQCSGGVYNNIYNSYTTITMSWLSTVNNIGTNSARILNYPFGATNPLVIDTAWVGGSYAVTQFGDSNHSYRVNNLYQKAFGTSLSTKPSGAVSNAAALDIVMLYIDWQQETTQDGTFTIGNDSANRFVLRGVTHQGNYVGTGRKILTMGIDGKTDGQIITTQNVDDWGMQSFDVNQDDYTKFSAIKDIEGFKQYWGGGNVIFADPTQFDTGTNSLRVSKCITTDQNQVVPIKSFYNSTSAEKAITIRAKATTSTQVQFGIMPNGLWAGSFNTSMVSNGIYTVTDTWADYIISLSADNAANMLNSFINVGILPSGDWASNYVWIDSITISEI